MSGAAWGENPEPQAAAQDVADALENERLRQEAFCQAIRTDPHAECVLPYFAQLIGAQVQMDPHLLALAEHGSYLLANSKDSSAE